MNKHEIQDEINRRSIWHARARHAAFLAAAAHHRLRADYAPHWRKRIVRDCLTRATVIRRTYWDAFRILPR
jgi:hypothetical protein